VKILPLGLETALADKMDEAWRAKGIKNRMEFFRGAIGHYLAHLGARDAAARFMVKSVNKDGSISRMALTRSDWQLNAFVDESTAEARRVQLEAMNPGSRYAVV